MKQLDGVDDDRRKRCGGTGRRCKNKGGNHERAWEGGGGHFPAGDAEGVRHFQNHGRKKRGQDSRGLDRGGCGERGAGKHEDRRDDGDAGGGHDNGTFSLSQPKNGWPAGQYRVEIYANDELATKVKFAIEAMEKAEKREAAEKAAGGPPDLNGKWTGYYDDGSKSEYVWRIRQTGSTLAISNVGGETAKSKGRVEGEKVVAEDFATTNGKLSPEGTKITWSDGVVWKKQ